MAKLRIYLDTSIISFLYADDSPEKKEITKEFFDKFLSEYDVYISRFVILELQNTTNDKLRKKLLSVIKKYNLNILEIDEEKQDLVYEFTKIYIDEGIIPEKKLDDAIHIAIATIFDMDILLSWNFRHLANIKKQIDVNRVNSNNGYRKELFIINPMEVIYENEI
jgi:predicted nucleic acid-binding protein